MADITVNNSFKDKEIYSDMYASQKSSKSSNSLGLDDFLYLLAAQMSNQDMMDPMSDTDFIAQLAQFSSLEAMQQLTQLTTTSYSASLLGKEVTVARILSDNSMVTVTGTVTGVGLFNDEPIIYLDGGSDYYLLSEIMVVGAMPEVPAETPDEGDGEGGDGDGDENTIGGDDNNTPGGEG